MFVLMCKDVPGGLAIRQRTRPEHLAYLREHAASIVRAGPMLNEAGEPCGSIFLLDMAERVAAEAFAANDPYALAGVFERVELLGYRDVVRDGRMPE